MPADAGGITLNLLLQEHFHSIKGEGEASRVLQELEFKDSSVLVRFSGSYSASQFKYP